MGSVWGGYLVALSFNPFPQLVIWSMVRPQPIHFMRFLSKVHMPMHGLLAKEGFDFVSLVDIFFVNTGTANPFTLDTNIFYLLSHLLKP